jgi:hypothetical protein
MHRRLCSKWRGASHAYNDAMSKRIRTSESAAVTAEPPAKTLVQPALQSFKGFAPLDTVELRSGRNVKKKTSIKSSGGSFKHKDFTVTNGVSVAQRLPFLSLLTLFTTTAQEHCSIPAVFCRKS